MSGEGREVRREPRESHRNQRGFRTGPWAERAVLAALVVVSVLFRFAWIDKLPPGLHYDQAVNALLAWETLTGHSRPIFYTAFTGMEPLMFYSIAATMAVMGHTGRAIHVTSAIYGSLTVVLTLLLARDMFGGPRSWRGRWVGLFAAGLMATSTWHLVNSRNGFRVITLPFCEALTLWALWVAFRTGRRRWYALAGAALGLTAYTYYASRLVPIALALFLGWLALRDRQLFRRLLPGLGLMVLAAAVVVAPLAVFYAQNPEYLFVRANQAWIFSDELSGGNPWGALWENVVAVLAMFSFVGDHNWRFNVAPRPILDWVLSVLTLGGLGVFAVRAARRGDTQAAAGYALTLIWVPIMLIPSFLSVEGRPNSVRGLGALPFLYFMPAVAVVGLLEQVAARVRMRRHWSAVAAGVWLAVVGWQAVRTGTGYFDYWANAPDTYYHYDADYVAMARAAKAEMAAGNLVVLATEHYKHTTIAWEAPETLDGARWLDGRAGIVYPQGERDIVYLLATHRMSLQSRAGRYLRHQGAQFETLAHDPVGQPSLIAARLARSGVPQPRPDGKPCLGGELWVVDGDVPDSHRRSGKLRLQAQWMVRRPASDGRTLAVRLVDQQGVVWGQADHLAYLSDQWRAGDVGWQAFEVRYDPAMPPGPYRVELALADARRKPMPVLDAQDRPTGLWANLGTIAVDAEGGRVEPLPSDEAGLGLRLVKHEALDTRLPPGGQATASVAWQRGRGSPPDTFRLEWLDASGKVAAEEALPIAGTYPPTAWRVGEVVRPRYRLTVPPTLTTGTYLLRASSDKLPAFELGRVVVEGPPRRFEPGPIQHPRRARVGDGIALLGYDVSDERPRAGTVLVVTLHWRALDGHEQALTRFVHLVDGQGVLRAQSDQVPAKGQRPTTGWVEGEVVVDAARLALPAGLPAGRYRLLTGFYSAETLGRLGATDEDGRAFPNGAVELGEIEVGDS